MSEMPSPKNRRRGSHHEKSSSKGRSSYDLRGGWISPEMLPKPRTDPDLLIVRGSSEDVVVTGTPPAPRLTKLLLNVTIQRSLGAVKVVMPLEATAEDLIVAALRQYKKEARVPLLRSGDASGFDLHYSQFNLESLDREEKLASLGARNFFLCPKKTAESEAEAVVEISRARCSNEAYDTKKEIPWLRFMEFIL